MIGLLLIGTNVGGWGLMSLEGLGLDCHLSFATAIVSTVLCGFYMLVR